MAMTKSDFFIHLNSGVDQDQRYYNNTTDDFTVRLAEVVQLAGQRWKCAMTRIILPTYWNTVNSKNNFGQVQNVREQQQRIDVNANKPPDEYFVTIPPTPKPPTPVPTPPAQPPAPTPAPAPAAGDTASSISIAAGQIKAPPPQPAAPEPAAAGVPAGAATADEIAAKAAELDESRRISDMAAAAAAEADARVAAERAAAAAAAAAESATAAAAAASGDQQPSSSGSPAAAGSSAAVAGTVDDSFHSATTSSKADTDTETITLDDSTEEMSADDPHALVKSIAVNIDESFPSPNKKRKVHFDDNTVSTAAAARKRKSSVAVAVEEVVPAKRVRRARREIQFDEGGGIDMYSFINHIWQKIPVHLRNVIVEVKYRTSKSKFSSLDPNERSFRMEIKVHEGSKFVFPDEYQSFWRYLGLESSVIDRDTIIMTFPYILLKYPVWFVIEVPLAEMWENRVVKITEDLHVFRIKEGFYGEVPEFITAINESLADDRIVFNLKPDSRKLQFTVPVGKQIQFSNGLADFIDFKPHHWYNQGTHTSLGNFTTHRVSSFYIYSNIIASSITCNIHSPVLAEIVPEKSDRSLSDTTGHPIPAPEYKEVSSLSFSEINIKIVDNKGRPVSFIGGETSMSLHFVRVG